MRPAPRDDRGYRNRRVTSAEGPAVHLDVRSGAATGAGVRAEALRCLIGWADLHAAAERDATDGSAQCLHGLPRQGQPLRFRWFHLVGLQSVRAPVSRQRRSERRTGDDGALGTAVAGHRRRRAGNGVVPIARCLAEGFDVHLAQALPMKVQPNRLLLMQDALLAAPSTDGRICAVLAAAGRCQQHRTCYERTVRSGWKMGRPWPEHRQESRWFTRHPVWGAELRRRAEAVGDRVPKTTADRTPVVTAHPAARRRNFWGPAAGRVKPKVAPAPGALRAQTRPCCASIRALTMARPRPLPPVSRRRAASPR